MKFKLGELFCGPGGIGYAAVSSKPVGIGLDAFEIEHAWASDYDCKTRSNTGPQKRLHIAVVAE